MEEYNNNNNNNNIDNNNLYLYENEKNEKKYQQNLLDNLLTPDENGLDFFRRVNLISFKTGLNFIDNIHVNNNNENNNEINNNNNNINNNINNNNEYSFDNEMNIVNGMKSGDLIELYGPSSSGKTQILLHSLSQFILPKSCGGFEGQIAIWFDLDTRGALDILRLEEILSKRLSDIILSNQSTNTNQLNENDILEIAVLECMRRVKYIHCSNTRELLAALEILHHDLLPHINTFIIINNLGSFFWKNRHLKSIKNENENLTLEAGITRSILRLRHEKGVMILAAKLAIFGKSLNNINNNMKNNEINENDLTIEQFWDTLLNAMNKLKHKDYLNEIWKNNVTSRILLVSENDLIGTEYYNKYLSIDIDRPYLFFTKKIINNNNQYVNINNFHPFNINENGVKSLTKDEFEDIFFKNNNNTTLPDENDILKNIFTNPIC